MVRVAVALGITAIVCSAAVGQSGSTAAARPPEKTPTPADGMTVEELVAKDISARGGLEKIKSVQTMRLTGDMIVEDQRMPSTLELKRPNKTRWEFTADGQTAVQAYDGTEGWTVTPFEGSGEPQRMSASDQRDIELQADMDGPLVDYKAKGHKIELVGRESVDGRDAWRLRVTLKNGDERDVYLDAKTFLQFRTVTRRELDGRTVEVRSDIGDYREVGGLMLPHSFEASVEGSPQKQSLKFSKIELNVPIDDSRFKMPERRETPDASATPAIS
jgi:outer membrane lipoprotein-sorting protein